MSSQRYGPVRPVFGIAAMVLVVSGATACTTPGPGAADTTRSDPAALQEPADVLRPFRELPAPDDAPPVEMSPLRKYAVEEVRRVGDVGAGQAYAAAAGEQVCLVLGLPGEAEEWTTGSACTTLEDFAQRGLTLSVEKTDAQGRWAPRAMLVPDGFEAPDEGWASAGPNLWVAAGPEER